MTPALMPSRLEQDGPEKVHNCGTEGHICGAPCKHESIAIMDVAKQSSFIIVVGRVGNTARYRGVAINYSDKSSPLWESRMEMSSLHAKLGNLIYFKFLCWKYFKMGSWQNFKRIFWSCQYFKTQV